MKKHEHKRLVAIMPAIGWRSVFVLDDGPDILYIEPLCGWGLVEGDCWEPGCRRPFGELLGLATATDGLVEPCGNEVNFLGYVGPGQDALQIFGDAARAYRRRRAEEVSR